MAIARQPFRSLAVAACIGLGALLGDANAAVTTLSGYLNDNTNTALVASDGTTATQFADDFFIANNVALYAVSVPFAGLVSFESTGFAAGGVDPYFTLFSSSGVVLGSNFDQAFSTGGDFELQYSLAMGSYTVALGAFANMSFAENRGGTLADGFTGLGEPAFLGTSFYELTVTVPDQGGGTVPEPSSLLLLLMGLSAFAFIRRGTAGAVWRSAPRISRACSCPL
jgi:hypothetical protein